MRSYQAALVGRSSLIEVNGHQALVQVAAQGSWQMQDVDAYTSGAIENVVLVDLTDGLREYYICPGNQLRSDVRKSYDAFLASKAAPALATRPAKHAAIYPEHVRRWHNE